MNTHAVLGLMLIAFPLSAIAGVADFACPNDEEEATDRCNFVIFSEDGLSAGGFVVTEGKTHQEAVSGPGDRYCMDRQGRPDADSCEHRPLVNYRD